ncbi:MAG: hypothetical protein COA47_13635 [Robiginitomaculum sp.]|nr:MAG: hypothetical protein COA47_13635 [Robiginitomaculum sp.]
MWWLAIPAVLYAGKKIYDYSTQDNTISSEVNENNTHTSHIILRQNIKKLSCKLDCDNKKIAFLGQPGSGKSSLINTLTDFKLDPQPEIGIKTDATSWSKVNPSTLVYDFGINKLVDVPGYGTSTHPEAVFQKEFPFRKFDLLVFIVSNKLSASDEIIFKSIRESNREYIVVRSLSEVLSDVDKVHIINDLTLKLNVDNVRFISNKSNEGISSLRNILEL